MIAHEPEQLESQQQMIALFDLVPIWALVTA
jgi:hypothetical protein